MLNFVIFVQCLCDACVGFVQVFSAQKACNYWVVQGVQGIARVYMCACVRALACARTCVCMNAKPCTPCTMLFFLLKTSD